MVSSAIISLAHLRDINTPGTELTLSINPDIWEIKKHLADSDVGNSQTRLMLPKDDVAEHILGYLTDEERMMIEGGANNHQGLRISVYDSDTKSTHWLSLKKWHSSGSYVLINNWNTQFVKRRKLKAGVLIGLFWNTYATRLHFRVLRSNN
ncbi:B3 domain-containing protein [Raphanus sativus]|uniref:B3 domain-containing protein At2g33720-like n=1 Tax=Raphanus sativus TaxID=3726 RepID=A0A6J0JKC1_RAPSA|nr:B3 domain-containing protein At2g33720-like [Raphanus sativus]KAJ4886130.1 B3 domain-containing protein [Raphanus sativus]